MSENVNTLVEKTWQTKEML